jgi:diguanylate cyclase (GGDEF)-like protein/PAS domain S-box-containing protein
MEFRFIERLARVLRSGGLRLAVLLALCAACGVVAHHFAYAGYARSQMSAASRSLAPVSAALGSLLTRHESLPRMLALDPRVAGAVGDARSQPAIDAANAYLAQIAASGQLLAAFVTDARGTTLAASNWDQPVTFVGKNYAFRPYFQQAMASGIGRFFAVGATSGEPGYFLAASVQGTGGAKGVVVVKVALESTLQAAAGRGGEDVAVVDEFGVVFLSSDPALLYRPVVPLTDSAAEALKGTQRYANRLGPPLQGGGVRGGERDTLTLTLAHQGSERLVRPVWQAIEGTPWQVVSFQDLQPARFAGWLGASGGVLLAALVIAAAVFVGMRRTRAAEIERSRDALRQSQERLLGVVDNLPVMVCFVSRDERFVFANALYSQPYGLNPRELEGKGIWEVLDPEDYRATQPQMKRALAGETVVFEREYRSMRSYRCFEATYRPEWNADKTAVTGVHVMTQDITQTRQRLQELARLSQLDHLTQLVNRKGFDARLEAALAADRPGDSLLALLFVDLDGFKPINDTHGHAAGDAVLVAFGKRVSRLVRADDLVARLGGDEFAVLLPVITDVSVAERVAASIVDLAQRPFAIDGGPTVQAGASVGVVCLPQGQACSAQALCQSADSALYAAKKKGRRTYVVGESPPKSAATSAWRPSLS